MTDTIGIPAFFCWAASVIGLEILIGRRSMYPGTSRLLVQARFEEFSEAGAYLYLGRIALERGDADGSGGACTYVAERLLSESGGPPDEIYKAYGLLAETLAETGRADEGNGLGRTGLAGCGLWREYSRHCLDREGKIAFGGGQT